jgi:hypothetical protein
VPQVVAPVSAPVVTPVATTVSTPVATTVSTPVEPTPVACTQNAFWNGNECVCEIGYIWTNGKCQVINVPRSVPVIIAYPDKKDCPED